MHLKIQSENIVFHIAYLMWPINIQKHLLYIDQKQFKRVAPLMEVISLKVRCLI